jgi:hypothetical protein
MIIELFQPEHLDQMDLRPEEAEAFALDPKARQKVAALAAFGVGGTMIHDGLILGVVGYYEMWPGRFAVWAFPSIHVQKYAMVYLRTAKRYLKVIEETHNPARIQTEAYADALHTRWMEFLGMRNETPDGMRSFSVTGRTMNLWSKVYEEATDELR